MAPQDGAARPAAAPEEAAVAGALVGREDRKLALEAQDGRADHRDLQAHGGVVEQVAGGEVVDAVDDDVVALDDLHDVGGVEADGVLVDPYVGVELVDRLLGGVDLRHADAGGGVDDLALQVGQVDHVVVDDAQRADAGRGEVQRDRRAQAAGAQQQHLGVEQLLLALEADLAEQEVAGVALALLRGELAGDLDVVAAVLPQRVAAGHGDDVLVPQLGERGGAEGRALAGGAVEDHALGAIGGTALDARLQVGAADVLGSGEVAGGELVVLPDVHDDGALVEELIDLGRVDLLHGLADAFDVFGA